MYFNKELNSPQIKYDDDNEAELVLASFIIANIGTSNDVLNIIKEKVKTRKKKGEFQKRDKYRGEICSLFVKTDSDEVTIIMQDHYMLSEELKSFSYKKSYLEELLKEWEKLLRQRRC